MSLLMARHTKETIRLASSQAGADFGCKVMGDLICVCEDSVPGSNWLERLYSGMRLL